MEELGLLGVGDEVGDVEEGWDSTGGVLGKASEGQRRGGPLPLLLRGGRRVLGRRDLHCCCCWLQFEFFFFFFLGELEFEVEGSSWVVVLRGPRVGFGFD